MLKRSAILLLLWGWVSATILSTVTPAQAAGEQIQKSIEKQVLLLIVNRLEYDDLKRMPNLQRLADKGAVGLMNGNTGGPRTDGNAYATMALGVPARVEDAHLQIHNAHEQLHDLPASVTYQQVQGKRAEQGVLLVSAAQLARQHSKREFAGSIGALGDALKEQGLSTALFGSGDRGVSYFRPAALITTDSSGVTRYGDVGKGMLTADPLRPYGVRTDYNAMWRAYANVRDEASLVVFDLADLQRLNDAAGTLEPGRYVRLRGQVLREMDHFFGRVLQETATNRLVLTVTPRVSQEAADRLEWLAPVVMAGGSVTPQTVLTSSTTRRDGIVSNLDVAPTVLHFLEVPQVSSMIGYPLLASTGLAPQAMDRLLERTVWTFANRGYVLGGLGVVLGLAVLAALYRVAKGRGLPASWVRGLLYLGLATPLCLYLLPMFRAEGLWETAGALFALFLLFVLIPFPILSICQTLFDRLVWLSTWTIGIVLYDTWQGGRLAKSSVLSYDPIVGARYYGVGNEYMGVMVGAALVLFAALMQKGQTNRSLLRVIGVGGGVLLTLFFASPLLGTNTGGALTMAGATALGVAQIRRLSLGKTLMLVTGALGGAVGILLLLNQPTATPSHIGMAAHQVMSGGFEELTRILMRKLDMVTRLFTLSVGPLLVLVMLGVFAYALWGQKGWLQSWQQRYSSFFKMVGALIGGAVVAMLTNDSGVVVAALMFLFAAIPTLLIGLEQENGASLQGDTPDVVEIACGEDYTESMTSLGSNSGLPNR